MVFERRENKLHLTPHKSVDKVYKAIVQISINIAYVFFIFLQLPHLDHRQAVVLLGQREQLRVVLQLLVLWG